MLAILLIAIRRRRMKDDMDEAEDDLEMTSFAKRHGQRIMVEPSDAWISSYAASVVASPWSSRLTSQSSSDSDALPSIWRDPVILAVRLPFEKIRFRKIISRGGFGEVLDGLYHDQRVAIKRLLPENRKKLPCLNAFLREVQLLSTFDHERIVGFVGVAWDSPQDLCILLEFMGNGDLRNILSDWKRRERPRGFDTRKLAIALHIAEGLTYLHTLLPKVIHRDLKSKNVLVNSDWEAKLSDFGASREESSRDTMTSNVGTSLWIAPEVMVANNYNEKADVYSFGVVLTELDTHELPFHHVTTPDGGRVPGAAIIHMVAMGTIRAEFSAACREDLATLGRSCLAFDAAARPTAGELRYRIREMLRAEQATLSCNSRGSYDFT
ncbi:hypothetical protein PINS_up016931 [Pythium insidiosum]|nr:hypothetical protein PINS_up016931 [Pythium insidiosum]